MKRANQKGGGFSHTTRQAMARPGARTGGGGEGEGRERSLPVAAGTTHEDLERVVAALNEAAIPFQVEENVADPEHPGEWAWRILVRPADLGRVRPVLEVLVQGESTSPHGAPPLPGGSVAAGNRPGPLFEPGSGDWIRPILVLTCIGLGAFLLFWLR